MSFGNTRPIHVGGAREEIRGGGRPLGGGDFRGREPIRTAPHYSGRPVQVIHTRSPSPVRYHTTTYVDTTPTFSRVNYVGVISFRYRAPAVCSGTLFFASVIGLGVALAVTTNLAVILAITGIAVAFGIIALATTIAAAARAARA